MNGRGGACVSQAESVPDADGGAGERRSRMTRLSVRAGCRPVSPESFCWDHGRVDGLSAVLRNSNRHVFGRRATSATAQRGGSCAELSRRDAIQGDQRVPRGRKYRQIAWRSPTSSS